MKIRKGFVSNSSSSSFIIAKYLMTEEQICSLMAYCSCPIGPYKDSWDVYEDDHYVTGFTIMNNNMDELGGLEDWFNQNQIHGVKWEHN